MDEVERRCQRLAIIDDGRMVAEGAPRELLGRRRHTVTRPSCRLACATHPAPAGEPGGRVTGRELRD